MIDFAKNYYFQCENEIQKMHQFSFQIAILVHITYHHNPNYVANPDSKKIIKEYHYYVSNDKYHDILFVQHYFELQWGYLQALGVYPIKHWVWSDGCSGQFKSTRCLYHVACYPQKTIGPHTPKGCMMLWNFFGSSHGKGKHDGAGVVVKRELQKEQLKLNVAPL